jgi:hypothetical protein
MRRVVRAGAGQPRGVRPSEALRFFPGIMHSGDPVKGRSPLDGSHMAVYFVRHLEGVFRLVQDFAFGFWRGKLQLYRFGIEALDDPSVPYLRTSISAN